MWWRKLIKTEHISGPIDFIQFVFMHAKLRAIEIC